MSGAPLIQTAWFMDETHACLCVTLKAQKIDSTGVSSV